MFHHLSMQVEWKAISITVALSNHQREDFLNDNQGSMGSLFSIHGININRAYGTAQTKFYKHGVWFTSERGQESYNKLPKALIHKHKNTPLQHLFPILTGKAKAPDTTQLIWESWSSFGKSSIAPWYLHNVFHFSNRTFLSMYF